MSNLISVKAYCEKCKKTEQISVDLEQEEVKQQLASHSGIYPVSITHTDHSAVVYIDGNGAARKVKYIDLGTQRLESAVSSQASIILNLAMKKKKGQILLLSKNRRVRDFVVSLGEILNANVPPQLPFALEMRKDYSLFTINTFNVYYGEFGPVAKSLATKDSLYIVDISELDLKPGDIKSKKGVFLLYNLQLLMKNNLQSRLNNWVTAEKNLLGLYDYRTTEDVAESVFRGLDQFSF